MKLRELRVIISGLTAQDLHSWTMSSAASSAIETARAAYFPSLRLLDLLGNPIGDDGVAALADSPIVDNLHELGLISVHLTDVGVAALAQSPRLVHLRELNLFENEISRASVDAVRRSPYIAHVGLTTNRDLPPAPGG